MPPKGTTEARAMMREKGKQRGEKEREYVYAFENKGNGPLEVFWI